MSVLTYLKGFFGPAARKPADKIDVAISVHDGSAVLLRDGSPILTLPAQAVQTMGKAIDDQRAAQRKREQDAARVSKRKPVPEWPDTVFIGHADEVPTLTDRVAL